MLFCPGPVLTSERVKSVLIHPDMGHRRPFFEQVVVQAREKILEIVGADDNYTAVIISGSGTAANESILSSIIQETDEVLLIINGEFGERLKEILSCYGCTIHVLSYPWGQPLSLIDIESTLIENPNIQLVSVVFHETSTGMRNPIRQIGQLVSDYGRKLFVDCVSAFGGEDLNVIRDHIDICSGVPNKALGGLPGVSFVITKRSIIPNNLKPKNIYLNLSKHIVMADQCNQTPNTPSVTMFLALNEALQELLDEGLDNRIRRYQECAKIIRDGVHELNLKMLIPDEWYSNTVTSVFLPQSINLSGFIDELDNRGYVVYPGKRHLYSQNMFQIANMGQIYPGDCKKFLGVLKETIQDLVLVNKEEPSPLKEFDQ
jgi:2-aminoethylphosphonate-pyruvate transaminase